MTSKLKIALVAAITAMSVASPALAQTTMQNGRLNTHQERSFRSEQVPDGAGSFNVETPTTGSGYVGGSAE
jgi:hypothetical protein